MKKILYLSVASALLFNANTVFAANNESESTNYDWLQGHWVYEQGNSKVTL